VERKEQMKSTILIYLLFVFGVLWYSLEFTRDYVLFLTPFVLLAVYIIVIYPELKNKNYRSMLWLIIIYIITLLIEMYGVQKGNIFGSYSYGETLGKKIYNVPLIIGMNWGMIIWGCAQLTQKLQLNLILKIIIASAAAVLLDIFIEPAAMKFDYWNWSDGIIPYQNYLAWFVISLLFTTSYFLLKIKAESNLPTHFYISQIIFFVSLSLSVV
jgi:bisanhydrobacterioruberin hydratase